LVGHERRRHAANLRAARPVPTGATQGASVPHLPNGQGPSVPLAAVYQGTSAPHLPDGEDPSMPLVAAQPPRSGRDHGGCLADQGRQPAGQRACSHGRPPAGLPSSQGRRGHGDRPAKGSSLEASMGLLRSKGGRPAMGSSLEASVRLLPSNGGRPTTRDRRVFSSYKYA
jgi:hypothetical protein